MSSRRPDILWVLGSSSADEDHDREALRESMAESRTLARASNASSVVRHVLNRPHAIVLGGWSAPRLVLARCLGKLLGVPLVAWCDSGPLAYAFPLMPSDRLRRWFFRGVDLVLTPDAPSTETALALGVQRSQIVESFSGADMEHFIALPSDRAARPATAPPATQKPRQTHRFVYVGPLVDVARTDVLIRAFADIRIAGDSLLMCGSGPWERGLRELARSLGVEASVRFDPADVDGDELLAIVADADTVVLPGQTPDWQRTADEALASGAHVVLSTESGVPAEIIDVPGVYVTDTSETELAWALRASRSDWDATQRHEVPLERGRTA